MLNVFNHHVFSPALLAGVLLFSVNANATPRYTTDLNQWGPHPETSLKQGLAEPRWMKLQDAERDKISACSEGQSNASAFMSTLARAEAAIDSRAKHGGAARTRPVGELAEEMFREQVESVIEGYSEEGGWPDSWSYGREIANMYSHHFGYTYWRKYYEPLKANPLTVDVPGSKLRHEIYEQFWPLCMEQVPIACFEEGPVDAKRCLAKLIHPKDFPDFEVVADLYKKEMTKPNGW